jgi:hypothetical protein
MTTMTNQPPELQQPPGAATEAEGPEPTAVAADDPLLASARAAMTAVADDRAPLPDLADRLAAAQSALAALLEPDRPGEPPS